MSIQTTADENIEEAKKHLDRARVLLYSVINDHNGYDHYSLSYQQQIKDVFILLFQEPLKARR
jgi:hypothetical protein